MTSPATRLILVRHGQTDYNAQARLQGQIDIPLNDVGRDQARHVAAGLSKETIDVIVSSPLIRARDTAEAIAAALGGAPVEEDPAFLEQSFGQWEGLIGSEIQERWPDLYTEWRTSRVVPGIGMEERRVVGERFARAARALVDAHPGRTVLVVSHGAAIRAGVTTLIGLDPASFHGIGGMGNCHRSLLEPLRSDPEGRSMRLLSHNVPPDFAEAADRL